MRDGPRGFNRNSSCSGLLRCRLSSVSVFAYGTFTLCGHPFQNVLLTWTESCWRSYNPGTRLATPPVWALPRSLAATGGIVFTFSSCGYLDVSVPRVCLSVSEMAGSLPPGCPIRKSTGRWVFAPDRGLSQLVTSFFASESQGIPHAPFVRSVLSLQHEVHVVFFA